MHKLNSGLSAIENAFSFSYDFTNPITKTRHYGHYGLSLPRVPTIPHLAQGGYVKPNTPQLAMIGDNRHQGEIVAPEDKMQAMVDRAVAMASNQNMTDQYLLMMIDLLKRIIEVIQALDLTVNIDIRDIKNKLKQLEDRSGYPLRG